MRSQVPGVPKSCEQVAVEALKLLRRSAEGMTKRELVQRVGGTSKETMQRAMSWLQQQKDAPVEYDLRARRWILRDRSFSLPLEAPDPEDVVAVLLGRAILKPLVDLDLDARLQRLVEQLDAGVRDAGGPRINGRSDLLTARLTLSTPLDPAKLRLLLGSLRRQVVRIRYASPWKGTRRTLHVEPWALRLHDGSAYLRGWCRESGEPRTFRMIQIEAIELVEGERPKAPAPSPEVVWGFEDPAYGIDVDRPDVAVIRLRGAVARWVKPMRWAPGEPEDHWLEEGELLERRVPYRSCRELARRLLGVIDAVEGLEPKELREEVERLLRGVALRGIEAEPSTVRGSEAEAP